MLCKDLELWKQPFPFWQCLQLENLGTMCPSTLLTSTRARKPSLLLRVGGGGSISQEAGEQRWTCVASLCSCASARDCGAEVPWSQAAPTHALIVSASQKAGDAVPERSWPPRPSVCYRAWFLRSRNRGSHTHLLEASLKCHSCL